MSQQRYLKPFTHIGVVLESSNSVLLQFFSLDTVCAKCLFKDIQHISPLGEYYRFRLWFMGFEPQKMFADYARFTALALPCRNLYFFLLTHINFGSKSRFQFLLSDLL